MLKVVSLASQMSGNSNPIPFTQSIQGMSEQDQIFGIMASGGNTEDLLLNMIVDRMLVSQNKNLTINTYGQLTENNKYAIPEVDPSVMDPTSPIEWLNRILYIPSFRWLEPVKNIQDSILNIFK